MKHVNSRFVVVGEIEGGDGQVTKYNEQESALATAIHRANLEDEMTLTNEGIAKAQADNEALINSIFGKEEQKGEIVFDDENIKRIERERAETIEMIWGKKNK